MSSSKFKMLDQIDIYVKYSWSYLLDVIYLLTRDISISLMSPLI